MKTNPWRSSAVRIALEGRSFIDTKRIHIRTLDEAYRFLESYGFDLEDARDREELEELRQEAITLIQEELLDQENIPESVVNDRDLRHYLVAASGRGNVRQGHWYAAILRVLHTLAHSHSYLNDRYHDHIREQILGRFEPHITEREGITYLGKLRLNSFEFRKAKTRRSVAMKLLHKAENVAADIFDWIGLRFITEYRADVLDVLAYLRNQHIVTFANIKPSRSRNSLIDLAWLDLQLSRGVPTDEIRRQMQQIDYPTEQTTRSDNKYSETSYHSVQITCRQRIKLEDGQGQRMCFFFPYEIQIMDKDSYQKSRDGLASHEEYKKRQRQAIRKRILPFLE